MPLSLRDQSPLGRPVGRLSRYRLKGNTSRRPNHAYRNWASVSGTGSPSYVRKRARMITEPIIKTNRPRPLAAGEAPSGSPHVQKPEDETEMEISA